MVALLAHFCAVCRLHEQPIAATAVLRVVMFPLLLLWDHCRFELVVYLFIAARRLTGPDWTAVNYWQNCDYSLHLPWSELAYDYCASSMLHSVLIDGSPALSTLSRHSAPAVSSEPGFAFEGNFARFVSFESSLVYTPWKASTRSTLWRPARPNPAHRIFFREE